MALNPAAAQAVAILCGLSGVWCLTAAAQEHSPAPDNRSNMTPISLSVEEGAPLRVITTQKIRFKENATVHARLTDPVYAFDREVVAPGAELIGTVTKLTPVNRRRRTAALLAGDFTPLRDPEIQFDTLLLKDGRRIPLKTKVTAGSGDVVHFEAGKKKSKLAQAKEAARDRIQAERRAVIDAVKTPGKLQRIGDVLLAKLPYHPQSWPAGTRLNADLEEPLDFGTANISATELSGSGEAPATDSVVHARLATNLDSSTVSRGTAVEAILWQPLFSQDHKLLYPVGSRLTGTVLQVRPARSWHRNGQLRFAFEDIQAPASAIATATAPARPERPAPDQLQPRTQGLSERRVQGQLEGVGGSGNEKVAMDSEGGTKATSSKARFIAPVVTLMLAGRGLDRDRVRQNGVPTGAYQSTAGGQAIAGAVGFGLIGAALGQVSRPFSAALGFYGAAWSVYSNVIGPGRNLTFPVETPIEVRLGSRTAPAKP
ncbi:MAG TPA: hypothetical protein VH325_06390 [Bryobacteraceae bacterium]|jgi:hypothetical protein|nr:hypothetical protein [Bryobacteraceae bacterium]